MRTPIVRVFPTKEMHWPRLHGGCPCAQPNQKSIFRFLVSELWLTVFTIFGDIPQFLRVIDGKKIRSKVTKFTRKMRNVLRRMKNRFLRFLVFEIWSFLY